MSGIYIPGMGMPKSCRDCWIEQEGFWCGALDGYQNTRCFTNERREDCPLVPVPEHGRLGDLDLLTKVIKAKAKNPLNQETVPYSWAFAYECLADAVGDMPTIIPVDKGAEILDR